MLLTDQNSNFCQVCSILTREHLNTHLSSTVNRTAVMTLLLTSSLHCCQHMQPKYKIQLFYTKFSVKLIDVQNSCSVLLLRNSHRFTSLGTTQTLKAIARDGQLRCLPACSPESLFRQMMPYRVAETGLRSARTSNWSRAARHPSRIQFSTT